MDVTVRIGFNGVAVNKFKLCLDCAKRHFQVDNKSDLRMKILTQQANGADVEELSEPFTCRKCGKRS